MSHSRSGPLESRYRCAVPSTNCTTWFRKRSVRIAGYCASALVLSLGKVPGMLYVGDHVVQWAEVQHRLPDRLGDFRAVVQERLRIHGLHIDGDLRRRLGRGGPWIGAWQTHLVIVGGTDAGRRFGAAEIDSLRHGVFDERRGLLVPASKQAEKTADQGSQSQSAGEDTRHGRQHTAAGLLDCVGASACCTTDPAVLPSERLPNTLAIADAAVSSRATALNRS